MAAGIRNDLKVNKGDRVAYLGQSCPELLTLLFACARLGSIIVPLNSRMTAEQLRVILSNCQPKGMLVESSLARHADDCLEGMDNVRLIVFGGSYAGSRDSIQWENLLGTARPILSNWNMNLDSPVLIAYTSGTTSAPKGAVLTQEALFYSALNSVTVYDITSSDEVLTIFPMFHVGGLTVQTTPAIFAGATVNILRQFEPGESLQRIEDRRISLMVASPAMARAITSHPDWDKTEISSLRCVGLGAAIVTKEVISPWEERGVPASGAYGLTEALPPATAVPIPDSKRKAGSIGTPPLYYQARVVDTDCRDVGLGERGEIVLKGPSVFKEYWNNPSATEDAFSEGWFHTGDVGHMDEEGYFYIDDRMKDIVIVGASNVYPADLERILFECEAIAEAAVIGCPDADTGEALVACVVLKEANSMNSDQIKALFEGRLASYQHPQDVVFLGSLPHTAVGKVQKPELRQLVTALCTPP